MFSMPCLIVLTMDIFATELDPQLEQRFQRATFTSTRRCIES